MMFAVITPALIIGACAERMKFSGYCVFSLLWFTLVYCPSPIGSGERAGFLNKLGALISPAALSCTSTRAWQPLPRPSSLGRRRASRTA